MVVAGEYVILRVVLTGHFTGKFRRSQGKGQPGTFITTDLLKVHNGHITDHWHIEDNLTDIRQMDG